MEVHSSHLHLSKVQEKDVNFKLQAFTLSNYWREFTVQAR